jgi:hypothetical protein
MSAMRQFIVIGFFLFILVSPLIGRGVVGDVEVSENRRLAAMPDLTLKDVRVGTFFSGLDRYFEDHFVFRGALIKTKSWIDYHVFGTSPTKKVFIGKEGWLFSGQQLRDFDKDECSSMERQRMRVIAKQLHTLEETLESSGRLFVFVVAPNKSTIYPEYVGVTRDPGGCHKSRYDLLLESFSEYPVHGFIRLDTLLAGAKTNHRLYLKTDTHWNAYGAVLAGESILRSGYQRYGVALDRQVFPDIMISPRRYVGNLSNMTTLGFEETGDFAGKVAYGSQISIQNLPMLKNGEPRYHIAGTPPRGKELLPRTVMYRDSFMGFPFGYLFGSFTQLDVNWSSDIPTSDGLEDLRTSKTVILEVVERDLSQIHIDMEKVREMVGTDTRDAGQPRD